MFNSLTSKSLEYTDREGTSIRPSTQIGPEKIDPLEAFSQLQRLHKDDAVFALGAKTGEISDRDFTILLGAILGFVETFYPENFDIQLTIKNLRDMMLRDPHGDVDKFASFLKGLCYGDEKLKNVQT